MKRVHKNGDSEYSIHEVYYNDNDKVEAWTENPIAPAAENIYKGDEANAGADGFSRPKANIGLCEWQGN